jgi:hypothetical protein
MVRVVGTWTWLLSSVRPRCNDIVGKYRFNIGCRSDLPTLEKLGQKTANEAAPGYGGHESETGQQWIAALLCRIVTLARDPAQPLQNAQAEGGTANTAAG